MVVSMRRAMLPKRANAFRDAGVVGRHHSTLAGGHVLRGVEGEGGAHAKRAGFPAIYGRAVSLAGIFHHDQLVALCDLAHRRYVGRVAVQVDRHDRASSRRDRCFDF